MPDYSSHPIDFLERLYASAVKRAMPMHNIANFLPAPPDPSKGRTLVLGGGKAAAAMAQAVEAHWPPDHPLSGLVVTRYQHTPQTAAGHRHRIEVVEAAHPVPDQAGLTAAKRMLEMASGLQPDDLVLCLISGGGSSLLTLPCKGLSLADKQLINRQLLESGANITEMNCVRKHLSRIKGGRLAAACAPAKVVTLAISDVPGDDPSVIASGPTVADLTTCADALAIIDRYRIQLPSQVRQALLSGENETPKPASFNQPQDVRLIATPQQSLQAAAETARAAGLEAYILSDEIEGESVEVGRVHAALARAAAKGQGPFRKPCVILSGGETTVTVKTLPAGVPRGQGGRAGEFCMGLLAGLQGQPGVYGLAADTDGIDGMQENAGARVAPDSLQRALSKGIKLSSFIDRNDAYGFFHAIDDLVVTGPTFTNVNDFRAILII
jgi:hydroxypyruvate reductase